DDEDADAAARRGAPPGSSSARTALGGARHEVASVSGARDAAARRRAPDGPCGAASGPDPRIGAASAPASRRCRSPKEAASAPRGEDAGVAAGRQARDRRALDARILEAPRTV